MKPLCQVISVTSMLALMGAVAPARAQMAVVDVGAIAQLIEQLETARAHLEQARMQYESLTGPRGMERLLAGTVRNYLPPDWQALEQTVAGMAGDYSALAGRLTSLVNANAVLTPEQLLHLSAPERQQLEGARQGVALLQATSRDALKASSERFEALQGLIDAIPGAEDPKAVLDLQARIGAEQAMLQNEHTKLMVLYQTVLAEDAARRQQASELAIANIGSLRRLPAMGLNK